MDGARGRAGMNGLVADWAISPRSKARRTNSQTGAGRNKHHVRSHASSLVSFGNPPSTAMPGVGKPPDMSRCLAVDCCHAGARALPGKRAVGGRAISLGGAQFPKDVIPVAVFLCVPYTVSYCDLAEIMARHGVSVGHAIQNRGVAEFVPLIADVARRRNIPANRSWRLDDTHVKVRRDRVCLCRAVDKRERTVIWRRPSAGTRPPRPPAGAHPENPEDHNPRDR